MDDVACIRMLEPSKVELIPSQLEELGAVCGRFYEIALRTNQPFILRAQW